MWRADFWELSDRVEYLRDMQRVKNIALTLMIDLNIIF
jgi:hypothetical protein